MVLPWFRSEIRGRKGFFLTDIGVWFDLLLQLILDWQLMDLLNEENPYGFGWGRSSPGTRPIQRRFRYLARHRDAARCICCLSYCLLPSVTEFGSGRKGANKSMWDDSFSFSISWWGCFLFCSIFQYPFVFNTLCNKLIPFQFEFVSNQKPLWMKWKWLSFVNMLCSITLL